MCTLIAFQIEYTACVVARCMLSLSNRSLQQPYMHRWKLGVSLMLPSHAAMHVSSVQSQAMM